MLSASERDHIDRIAVFRALNLGDMLCAVPAFRALRGLYPSADITLIGLPSARPFQQRFSAYLDGFVAFPGYPGLPEREPVPDEISRFFEAMRTRAFDLALQMHGSGPISNQVVARLGARHTVGLGEAEDARAIELRPYPHDVHEIHRNLRVVEVLGAREVDTTMEFPLLPADWEELRGYPEFERLLERPFICLQPGARQIAKRWPSAHFAEVGDALAARGLGVAITGSSGERSLAEAVAAHMRYPAVIAACDISIGGLAALLSCSVLLVSNDTGVAHLATGLGLPSVVIFFATDPMRWAPLDTRHHRVVHDPAGVGVEPVLAASLEVMDEQRGRVLGVTAS